MPRRKRSLTNSLDTAGDIALVIFVFILAIALSWGITSAIVWLITLCFGLEFNLLYATGIWLMLSLLSSVFSGGVKVNMKR